jgi:hypothetical protein
MPVISLLFDALKPKKGRAVMLIVLSLNVKPLPAIEPFLNDPFFAPRTYRLR